MRICPHISQGGQLDTLLKRKALSHLHAFKKYILTDVVFISDSELLFSTMALVESNGYLAVVPIGRRETVFQS